MRLTKIKITMIKNDAPKAIHRPRSGLSGLLSHFCMTSSPFRNNHINEFPSFRIPKLTIHNLFFCSIMLNYYREMRSSDVCIYHQSMSGKGAALTIWHEVELLLRTANIPYETHICDSQLN